MDHSLQRPIKTGISILRPWWDNHGAMALRLAVALMALVAFMWLGYEFWRLLWGSEPIWPSSPTGAVDLKLRHEEVHHWFLGKPVYGTLPGAIYPPASYALLWPLLGWLDLTPARWLWAVMSVLALVWLIYLIIHESGADTPLESFFVALMPLSMYATGATIGNGQLIVLILPAILAGLLMLHRRQDRWSGELLAAALVLMALVKPSISVPFFWIVLFVPRRLRPALLVSLGYVALTLFAVSFQEVTVFSLLRDWLTGSSGAGKIAGEANLHILLTALGLEELILPASLLVLLTLGFWAYRYRQIDIWLLMGVTAIAARFWSYHRWYDDLLILLPLVALFRIAKRGLSTDGSDIVAGVLLAITLCATLAPGGLYLFSSPWNNLYVAGQVIVWIVVLVFLLNQAAYEKNMKIG